MGLDKISRMLQIVCEDLNAEAGTPGSTLHDPIDTCFSLAGPVTCRLLIARDVSFVGAVGTLLFAVA